MKILIVAPIIIKQYAHIFNADKLNVGSWISSIVNFLNEEKNISIIYLIINKSKTNKCFEKVADGIRFIKIDYKSETFLEESISILKYDICYVFGIEHNYIKELYNFLDYNKTLIHIQGVITFASHHYLANYTQYTNVFNPIFKFYMIYYKMQLKERSRFEREILSRSKYITGRTFFDKTFVKLYNSNALYFYNDEIINEIFFLGEWSGFKKGNHTIFISQMHYPIKAGHMVVEMVKYIKRKYPNVRCLICGKDISNNPSIATKLKFSYSHFIIKLIKKYNLEDNFIFLGPQEPEQLVEIMSKSAVCLIPSAIENSSNCMQEAMLLGMPIVASFVGGMPSIAEHNKSCLFYPFDAPYMAASNIMELFENRELSEKLSLNAYNDIRKRYDDCDPKNNLLNILEYIYNENN